MNDLPLLSLLVLTPLLMAPIVARMADAERARRAASAGALLALLLAGVVAARHHRAAPGGFAVDPWTPGPGAPLLGVDSLTAVLLPFVGLLVLAVLVGGPRRELSSGSIARLLASEGAYLGLFCALDLRIFALFWAGTLLPCYADLRRLPDPEARRRATRIFVIFPLVGSLPLLAALALMHHGGAEEGLANPFSIPELLQRGLPPQIESIAFGLLWVTVLMRAGIVPLHSWLPALFERGSLWVVLLMGSLKPGLYLLLRLSWRMLPHASERWLNLLLALGLATALYGAMLGLAQRSLRTLLGSLSLSHAGLMLAGLCTRSIEGETGGLTQWLSIGTATTGLVLVVWALEARTGTSSPEALGGVVRRAPALTGAFLIFGLGTLGLPGTLTFIGEDLLLHGVASASLACPVVLALSSALNAAAVMRAYTRAFLGPPRASVELVDLQPRERAAALGLAVVLVAGSLLPSALVREEARAIDSEMTHPAAAPHHAP